MSDSGFASLGPTLLARKGGAKPAMRPQLPVLSDPSEVAKLADEQLEDLGWNDMGEDGCGEDGAVGDVVVPIDPAAPFDPAAAQAHSPIVRRQQRRLEERVLADAVMTGPERVETDEASEEQAFTPALPRAEPFAEPAPQAAVAAPRPASAVRRAAFTLRLDPERHLKLRLAAAMQGMSAQALVTDALDRLLAEFDELDAIAARVQRH